MRRHVPEAATWAVTLWFAFGTLLRPLAYNYSPDVLSALLVLGGYLAVVGGRQVAAGALLGLSLWAKLPNVVLLLPLASYAVMTWTRRDLAVAALTLAGPVLALGALNAALFGSPFVTAYDRVINDPRISVTALELSHRTFFDVPFWSGLWTQLTHRQLGLFVSAPAVVLAMPGLLLLWKRARGEAFLVGSLMLAQIAFYAPYRLWDQTTHGHRFVLTAIVLAAVPVGVVLARLSGSAPQQGAPSVD